MEIIKTVKELERLPLSLPLMKQVTSYLAEGWDGDLDEMAEFWNETGTFLIFIDENDNEQAMCCMDEQTASLLEFTAEFPEYVLLLPDDVEGGRSMLLGIGIFSDDGGGCCVLADTRSKLNPVKQLLAQIDR